MKVLGSLCRCGYCRSRVNAKYDCGCWIGRERDGHLNHQVNAIIVDGVSYPIERVVNTGGRNAIYIYLEDGEDVIWLSARRVGEPVEDEEYEEVGRFDATVHSCWKMQLHQELVVVRKRKS